MKMCIIENRANRKFPAENFCSRKTLFSLISLIFNQNSLVIPWFLSKKESIFKAPDNSLVSLISKLALKPNNWTSNAPRTVFSMKSSSLCASSLCKTQPKQWYRKRYLFNEAQVLNTSQPIIKIVTTNNQRASSTKDEFAVECISKLIQPCRKFTWVLKIPQVKC